MERHIGAFFFFFWLPHANRGRYRRGIVRKWQKYVSKMMMIVLPNFPRFLPPESRVSDVVALQHQFVKYETLPFLPLSLS